MKTSRSPSPAANVRKKTRSLVHDIPPITEAQQLTLSLSNALVGNVNAWVGKLKASGAPRAFMVGVFKRIKNEGMAFFDDLESTEELSEDQTSIT